MEQIISISLILATIITVAGYIYLGLKRPGIALTTCLLPLLMLPILGYLLHDIVIEEFGIISAIITALIPIITVLTIAVNPCDGNLPEPWPRIVARWLATVFSFIAQLCIFVFIFNILGFIFWTFFVAFFVRYKIVSNKATASIVISTLATSAGSNLPLPSALFAAAGNLQNKQSQAMRRIANWLTQGFPLSESIRRGYSRCPAFAVSSIAVAERMDRMPSVLKNLQTELADNADETKIIRPVNPYYPMLVVGFTLLISFGLFIFIIPTFAEVLNDMCDNSALPTSTQLLLNITHFLLSNHGLVPLLLFFGMLALSSWYIWVRVRQRRPDNPRFFSRLGDWIKWHLPFLHWFEKNYSLCRITEVMRLSLEVDQPLNIAISNTLSLDINEVVRGRLKKWLEQVQLGKNISQSARDCRVSDALAWAFDEKINKDNTLEVLEMLQETSRNNYLFRANVIRSIAWPIAVVTTSFMVGFICYAVFSPMIAIINHLTVTAMP